MTIIDAILNAGEAERVTLAELEPHVATGVSMLMLTSDPAKDLETPDVAVAARELARAYRGRLRFLMLDRADESAAMARFGAAALPALVFFRDGEKALVIPRIKAWSFYTMKASELLGPVTEKAA